MMPVHECAKIGDFKEKDALYIEFEVQKIKVFGVDNSKMDMNSEPESVVIVDNVTTALMNRHNRYVQLKQSAKYGNHQQFNALVALRNIIDGVFTLQQYLITQTCFNHSPTCYGK